MRSDKQQDKEKWRKINGCIFFNYCMLITQLIREKSCLGLVENHPKTRLTSFDFKKQLENNQFRKSTKSPSQPPKLARSGFTKKAKHCS